ncbi:MAG: LysR family transcriptional regulator [Burkholderiales bacterium]|nr:LysR family transcriptional regulator [Burkholderiales bacterium]
MTIDLRQIRHALALGRYRNFARAAEALNLTQPSLSRSIAALERTLEVPLFDRTRKGVAPTAFGRVLLEQGELVLRREADLRREIQLLAGLEGGTLSVGAGPYASEISVASAIARVAATYPRLKIRFATADPADVIRDVLAERLDVGIAGIAGLEHDDRLAIESLPSHRIVLACRPGHPLASQARPALARVLDFPLVTTLLRGVGAAVASSQGKPAPRLAPVDQDLVPHILVNSLALARLIARESDAIFPGTTSMLAEDVASGHLTLIDFDMPSLKTDYGVLYLRSRTLAPAARVLIDVVQEIEANAQSDRTPATSSAKRASDTRGGARNTSLTKFKRP